MEIDAGQAFRRAMSAYATGVTVVSAARENGRVLGMTANSLTSVSLNPPLLLWCLGDKSTRYDVFSTAELWGLTILGAEDQAVARRFAKSDTEGMEAGEADMLSGAPVLRTGVAQFACRTHLRQRVGDHLIIVGEVIDQRAHAGEALTFFRGAFGRAGEAS